MRLSVSVNDQPAVTGSLTTTGWLAAHAIVTNDESDEQSNRVWINAIDTSEEPNTTHIDWEAGPLAVGDIVEIKILPDGEVERPTNVRRTSESPRNLFSSIEKARLLLAAIKTCDDVLMSVLDGANGIEPPDELKKIQLALMSVSVEMDRQLISPTLRRHPELLAEAEALKIR